VPRDSRSGSAQTFMASRRAMNERLEFADFGPRRAVACIRCRPYSLPSTPMEIQRTQEARATHTVNGTHKARVTAPPTSPGTFINVPTRPRMSAEQDECTPSIACDDDAAGTRDTNSLTEKAASHLTTDQRRDQPRSTLCRRDERRHP
jgi:hypothetical protein